MAEEPVEVMREKHLYCCGDDCILYGCSVPQELLIFEFSENRRSAAGLLCVVLLFERCGEY